MNELDKIFKNKLNHYSTDVPDDIWSNIEAKLDKSERKIKPKAFRISSVLLLFITLTVGSYFLKETTESIRDVSKTEQKSPITNSENIPQPIASLANNLQIYTEATNNKSVNSILNGNSTRNLNVDIIKKDNSSNLMIAKNNSQNVQSDLYDDELILPEKLNSADNIARLHLNNDHIGTIDLSENSNDEIATFSTMQYEITHVDHISSGQISTTSLNSLSAKSNLTKNHNKTEPIKACPFNVEYKDKSIDIYFSSDYIDKQLTDRAGGAKLKEMRIATESPMYSFSAGLRLGYNIGYRWNIHTGINYSQINEKFKYTDPESSKVRIVIVKDYIYEHGQVVDSIVKQEEVLVPGSTELTIYNKFKTIDIPILARYTILANRHLSLSAVGGVFINIASYEKGTIISDATHKPVALTKAGSDEGNTVYKNQLGMSLYGSLSVAYHLTENTDLLLEPYAKIQPQSITIATYPLFQKYNTYGINLGLRYKF